MKNAVKMVWEASFKNYGTSENIYVLVPEHFGETDSQLEVRAYDELGEHLGEEISRDNPLGWCLEDMWIHEGLP